MKNLLPFCCLLAIFPYFVFAEAQGASPSPLNKSTQLIVVVTPGWNATNGQLQRYGRRLANGPWIPVGDPVPIVVGKTGMGWGIGIATVAPAHSIGEPVKKEGDRRSPAGIFSLGTAFGYAPHAPDNWKMPYLALTSSIECVDDSHSHFYNRVVDRSTVSPDWSSSEHMRAAGEAYRWGIVINHNSTEPRPEGGSCVFMHIWGGTGSSTVGCTAMPEEQIRLILDWLDPASKPLLVQMPLGPYQKIEKLLHLPPPPSAPRL